MAKRPPKGNDRRAQAPDWAWDVFISHASEDKSDFVRPLASALSAFGVTVWYDDYSLKLGDSLSRSIDEGLAKSNYGLVVLSPAFLAKKWPEYELRGLTAREMVGRKVILPIWHNVSQQDILEFSPPLADKLAVKTDKRSPVQIATLVIKAIRPDIFTRIARRMVHYRSMDKAKVELIELSKLRRSPIRHPELPSNLVGRIRLIRASLFDGDPHSMEFWMDSFKRDTHPSKEIEHWEHVAAVYREYVAMVPALTEHQRRDVARLVSSFWMADKELLASLAEDLPSDALSVLVDLYSASLPPNDIVETIGDSDDNVGEGQEASDQNFDLENFPVDLPEHLIRELMNTKSGRK